MNTCEVKSSVKIIMATKKWKCLRARPDRGNGCCHGNRVFEIKLKSKSLNRFSFTDNSRRHQQDHCAFLMNIVYRSKKFVKLWNIITLSALFEWVFMIWRSMIVEVSYQKILLDIEGGLSYQLNPGWIWRWMILNMFCWFYLWSSWIKIYVKGMRLLK